MNTGKDCWYKCNRRQGPCPWCGSEGYCCTQQNDWNDTSNGCDGTFGGVSMHECALKPSNLLVKIKVFSTSSKSFEIFHVSKIIFYDLCI